jgi:hypothetical protein
LPRCSDPSLPPALGHPVSQPAEPAPGLSVGGQLTPIVEMLVWQHSASQADVAALGYEPLSDLFSDLCCGLPSGGNIGVEAGVFGPHASFA